MAVTNNENSVLSADIYNAANLVEEIKKKYVDISEDTLFLGIYGYFQSIFQNLVQNTATVTAEYANEAIPTRAKFEKNIMAHALALGINSIFAKPAEIEVVLTFPEEVIRKNLNITDNSATLTIDKYSVFNIGQDEKFPYLLDYDIILKRIELPQREGEYTYTAMYDIDKYGMNKITSIINPYLSQVAKIKSEDGKNLIILQTTLHQLKHTEIYNNIIISNPLESMTIVFEFEDQLSYFYVEVNENTPDGIEYHYLEPVYEGIFDYESENEFINYLYLDNNTFRLRFNRNSYQPLYDAEVVIHVFTTNGDQCNFELKDYQIVRNLTSERFSYNGLYYMLNANSDSQFARNIYSIERLQQFIPKEALARKSITTYTDLINYFNAIQTEDCRMYLLRRVHNQLERIYYCYLLMKQGGDIVPTNTCTVLFNRGSFKSLAQNSYVINAGTAFFQKFNEDKASVINNIDKVVAGEASYTIDEYEKIGFLYLNPFLIVINKTPFYISYFNTYINYSRSLHFQYINEQAAIQFIATGFSVYKNYFDNPNNETHIEVKLSQNINNIGQDLVIFNSQGEVSNCKISVFAVLYTEGKTKGVYDLPFKYIQGKLKDYSNLDGGVYTFDFCITTNYRFAPTNTDMYFDSGLKDIKSGLDFPSYLKKSMGIKFFFTVKLETVDIDARIYTDENNEVKTIDDLFPGLEEYTLTNIYNAGKQGIELYYDYTDYMNSFIKLDSNSKTNYNFIANKVPLVRYKWWATEEKVKKFFKMFEFRKSFIDSAIIFLEDSFGVDYKLFNTYGKSYMYNIEDVSNIDRVNLSLKFEIKFRTKDDQVVLDNITRSIKEYIEDINIEDISDLHISNLCTYIKNTYSNNIIYIKFIKLNNYETLFQSIYKNPELESSYFRETQIVPEFINVNSIITDGEEDKPDITYIIKV